MTTGVFVLGLGIALRSPGKPDQNKDRALFSQAPSKPGPKVDSYDIAPSFVVKAMRESSTEKIFINIYQTGGIFENEIVLKPLENVDHKNQRCSVYPVLLSEECISKTKADVQFLEQVVLQILRNINQYNPECTLETAMVKLPKIKKGYVGEDMQSFSRDLAVHTMIFNGQGLQLDNEDDRVSIAPPQPSSSLPVSSTSAKPSAAAVSETPIVSLAAPQSSITSTSSRSAASTKAPELPPVNNSPIPEPPSPQQNMPPSPFPSAPPKMMGWLQKRGHLVKNWKTRYFVLNNGFIIYYTDASDKHPYGNGVAICLLWVSV